MKAVPKWAFATLFAEVGLESDGEIDLTGLPLSPMSHNQGISTLATQLQHHQLTSFQEGQLDTPVEAPSQHRRTPARIRMLLLSPYSHCVIYLHCFRMLERAYRFIHLVYHRSSLARSGILSLPPYITGVPPILLGVWPPPAVIDRPISSPPPKRQRTMHYLSQPPAQLSTHPSTQPSMPAQLSAQQAPTIKPLLPG
jgi:hypothetical protein